MHGDQSPVVAVTVADAIARELRERRTENIVVGKQQSFGSVAVDHPDDVELIHAYHRARQAEVRRLRKTS